MGKQRKLRSSMKVLHDALTSFRPVVGAPLCMQPTKTHSFRDIFASFDSVDYVLPVAAASPVFYSDPCNRHGLLLGHPQKAVPAAEHGIACKVEEGEDEGSISVSGATTVASSSTSCSSCLSSSSLAAAAAPDDAKEDDAEAKGGPFPNGVACTERFFFSPCSSKSIAAESSPETGPRKASPLRSVLGGSEGEDEDEDEDDVLLEREIEDTVIDLAAATGVSALCRDSVPVAFSSRDLYGDFRSSMEEMVAAHGLRDWPDLQELLHCYLCLNDKETHKVIALAFVDLLMHLSSQGKVHSSAVHGAASTPMFFPSPPLPAPGLHPSPSPC
ncbi:hypothetical protein Taro_000869 [Colocasia esculenta]|uniref:Transcription repressor n=1 Tax=Colocasia esculenta TaxID=4460 RepID=A0A843TIX3_COLES|nr:hypothetical protein [Colocasia esculenta]